MVAYKCSKCDKWHIGSNGAILSEEDKLKYKKKLEIEKHYIKKVSQGRGYPSSLSRWRREFESRWDRKLIDKILQKKQINRQNLTKMNKLIKLNDKIMWCCWFWNKNTGAQYNGSMTDSKSVGESSSLSAPAKC